MKHTLYFGNPAYLSLSNGNLIIKQPEVERNHDLPESIKQASQNRICIEDIGVVMLDHQQITLTNALMVALLQNNVAIINCDEKHHPIGYTMPLEANTLQSERFKYQTEASAPLKKQLWQQTIVAKIRNQAQVLDSEHIDTQNMYHWANSVKSGDTDNHEGRAAAYYWSMLFSAHLVFYRRREGEAPNHLLNYGYAIIRAVVARSLVAFGLLPTLGIFHRNKYNAYCLADDIMEPYRPYVDALVLEWVKKGEHDRTLDKETKTIFLKLLQQNVNIGGERSPLMVAVNKTCSSLAQCYLGKQRKIIYPDM